MTTCARHRPNGSSFTGLFGKALEHYKDDPRVTFVFALAEEGLQHIEPTVRAIGDNGNQVTFNYWSEHGTDSPLHLDNAKRTLAEALRVKDAYPDVVVSHPYFIQTLITGGTHWGGQFGYEVCPSISVDLPEHAARVANGHPVDRRLRRLRRRLQDRPVLLHVRRLRRLPGQPGASTPGSRSASTGSSTAPSSSRPGWN